MINPATAWTGMRSVDPQWLIEFEVDAIIPGSRHLGFDLRQSAMSMLAAATKPQAIAVGECRGPQRE